MGSYHRFALFVFAPEFDCVLPLVAVPFERPACCQLKDAQWLAIGICGVLRHQCFTYCHLSPTACPSRRTGRLLLQVSVLLAGDDRLGLPSRLNASIISLVGPLAPTGGE